MGMFNSPGTRGINNTTDAAQNYRGLLLAKVTAVNTPLTGPLKDRPVNDWIEQSFDPATGLAQDAAMPRIGKYTSPTVFPGCLIDANDASIPINSFAWIRMKGLVAGNLVYESIAGASANAQNVRLVASGIGPDDGLAWRGYPQIEVDGVEVDAPDQLGPNGTNYYVMYPTKAADGSVGFPQSGDIIVAIPDKVKANIWGFIPKKPSVSQADCSTCGWLSDIPTTTCWRLFRRGGSGRCACFPYDADSLNGGLDMFYDGANWTGDGMFGTCCGCGGVTFNISGDSATLSLSDVHVSCASSGSGSGSGSHNIFSGTYDSDCCGTITDPKSPLFGRKFVHFTLKGPDVCSGDQGPCDNTANVIVICGFPCPSTSCDCLACDTSNPIVFEADISGFSDNNYNGKWVYSQNPGDGCTFAATCGSVISTLTFTDGTPGTWNLDHGGNLYHANRVGTECETGFALNKDSGSGPSAITLLPKHGLTTAVCCSGIDLSTLPDSFDVHLGTLTSCFMSGASETVTKISDTEWQWVNPDTTTIPRIISVEVICTDGQFFMGWTGCCGDPICANTNTFVEFTGKPDNIIKSPLFIIWSDGIVRNSPIHAGCCPDATGVVGWIGSSSKPDTWDCTAGVCVLQSTGLGEYTTLSDCVDACNTPTYLCIDGVCVEQTDGGGMTLAECMAIPCESPIGCCVTELAAHPDLVASYRGFTATLVWTGSFWQSTGTGLAESEVTVKCVDGVWQLTWTDLIDGYTFTDAPANAQGCDNMFAIFSHKLPSGQIITVTVVHP